MKFNHTNKNDFKKNEEKDEELNSIEDVELEEKETEEIVEKEEENITEEVVETDKEKEDLNDKENETEILVACSPENSLKKAKMKDCELLNFRKEPKVDSEILFVIKKTDEIYVLEELEDFYKLIVNNKEGYCIKKFIEVD